MENVDAKAQHDIRILPRYQHVPREPCSDRLFDPFRFFRSVSYTPSSPIPLTPRAMGWLKLGARSATTAPPAFEEDLKYTTQHIETVSIGPATSTVSELFPIISRDIPDERLPFIPAEKVKKRNSVENGGLCKFNCDSWFIFYANTGKSLWSIISFMIVQNS